jgi:hypothetical protein
MKLAAFGALFPVVHHELVDREWQGWINRANPAIGDQKSAKVRIH